MLFVCVCVVFQSVSVVSEIIFVHFSLCWQLPLGCHTKGHYSLVFHSPDVLIPVVFIIIRIIIIIVVFVIKYLLWLTWGVHAWGLSALVV